MRDASFKSFVLAFGASWFDRMSGGLGVPLMIAGTLWADHPWGKALGLTGVAALVAASYRVWGRERESALAAFGTAGGINVQEIAHPGTYNVSATDQVVFVDVPAGFSTTRLVLPADPSNGRRIEFKRGANPDLAAAIVIDGNGKQIDGSDSTVLVFPNEAKTLTYSKTRWFIS